MIRAKFYVNSKTEMHDGNHQINLLAVFSPDPNHENRKYWEATPNGQISMTIAKPEVVSLLTVGQEYYVDITPAN